MSDSASYYDTTAAAYDSLREREPEHIRALELSWPLLPPIASAIDVGCGTGLALKWLRSKQPTLELHGLEPSAGMIKLAQRDLPDVPIKQGVGERIDLPSKSMDLALATSVMHHADDPTAVIDEMFRVARKAVLISDHNNYAFGGDLMRRVRLGLKVIGLLKPVLYVRQGFSHKGYSEDDGWWYPYSLFDNYGQIASLAHSVVILPTRPVTAPGNILYAQSHFAVLAFLDSRSAPAR